MADIVAMTLPDNKTYYFKDSRVAVPVPANAVFTDHIFSGLAEDVDYDNTASGLTSTNVQDALDEIAEGGGGGSTGCVELTQAQYDALSREAKMADVIYLITDSPDNYLDEVFGDFASVEYTSTASKAYAVGDYLVYDSKFYKVTSAIAQGATIVPNTNVVKTTVADEFSNASNVDYSNTTSGLTATTVQSALDEIGSYSPKYFRHLSSGYTHTTQNTWENTNFSVTVPANHRYVVFAYQNYASGKPIGLGFALSNSATLNAAPDYCVEGTEVHSMSCCLTPGTYYLYTKRATAGASNNSYVIDVLDFYVG